MLLQVLAHFQRCFLSSSLSIGGRREQKKYGKTLGGKAVDITKLNELASMG